MNTLSKNLMSEMVRKGLTINQLANKAGISKTCIYRIIKKVGYPNSFNLYCIAKTLGVSMDWLWGDGS